MIAAVIPTRNEEQTIGALVQALTPHVGMVVVSDDSTDMTDLAALSEGATIVDPPPGLGNAYLEAWKKIPDNWWVVHVDAGGSHPVESVQRVIDTARSTTCDVVVGSRFVEGGEHNAQPHRVAFSWVAAHLCSLVCVRDVTDWTSGLRAYSPRARAALRDLEFQTEGHAWQVEALAALFAAGMEHVEVPIRYEPSTSSLSWPRLYEFVKLVWGLAWAR